MAGSALVLGGGGVAGIAWMTGLLLGLFEEGVDLRVTDRLIGTSAGATVAAQLASDTPLADLFDRQVDARRQVAELAPDPALLAPLFQDFARLQQLADPGERLREAGRLALGARTVDEAARRAVIAARLPSHEWPARRLEIVAIDTASGATMLFDRHSGVALVDAVAASCAVPGIWPPVTLGARRLMDGGMRSADNADLAEGVRRVVVISPSGVGGASALAGQVRDLEEAGASVRVVEPDADARAAMGQNPLSPETREPAATAGRAQGRLAAAGFRAAP